MVKNKDRQLVSTALCLVFMPLLINSLLTAWMFIMPEISTSLYGYDNYDSSGSYSYYVYICANVVGIVGYMLLSVRRSLFTSGAGPVCGFVLAAQLLLYCVAYLLHVFGSDVLIDNMYVNLMLNLLWLLLTMCFLLTLRTWLPIIVVGIIERFVEFGSAVNTFLYSIELNKGNVGYAEADRFLMANGVFLAAGLLLCTVVIIMAIVWCNQRSRMPSGNGNPVGARRPGL